MMLMSLPVSVGFQNEQTSLLCKNSVEEHI